MTSKFDKTDSKTSTEKWEIKLGSRDGQYLEQLCSATTISEAFEKIQSHAHKSVIASCIHAFAKKFFKIKTRPVNPEVVSMNGHAVDCQALFVFNDRFKICVALPIESSDFNESWGKKTFIQKLIDSGMQHANAKKFVDKEVEIIIGTHYLTLQEMIDGKVGSARSKMKPDELTRSAGLKLEAFMKWDGRKLLTPLTEEEKEAISYQKLEYRLQPGMLDRILDYCNNVQELESLLSVVQPVLSLKNQEFGINDKPSVRAKRLESKFNDVFHAGD